MRQRVSFLRAAFSTVLFVFGACTYEGTCAALPGGYYSQRFTTPLFRPDAPNAPTIESTCPY